ncbi:MAG TPA: DUF2071 domain-containing protein [Acidobacteriota bacterium]|nr:DUF2071 domain-containing protein [Acidobacteriota bacterium]
MHLELAGFWKPAFSLWYSVDPAALEQFLPPGFKLNLSLRRAGVPAGHLNIFISFMDSVRPAGLPDWCGIQGWQINYCIYVASSAEASGEVKGLYVLRSFIDEKHFAKINTLMPYFHFQPAAIQVSETEDALNFEIAAKDSTNSIRLAKADHEGTFRSQSLGSWQEAMNFLQHRNTFILSSGDFLEFGDLRFNQNGKRIIGPIGNVEFHPELNPDLMQLEFASQIESADFHLILGRRERPAPMREFAEIQQ